MRQVGSRHAEGSKHGRGATIVATGNAEGHAPQATNQDVDMTPSQEAQRPPQPPLRNEPTNGQYPPAWPAALCSSQDGADCGLNDISINEGPRIDSDPPSEQEHRLLAQINATQPPESADSGPQTTPRQSLFARCTKRAQTSTPPRAKPRQQEQEDDSSSDATQPGVGRDVSNLTAALTTLQVDGVT